MIMVLGPHEEEGRGQGRASARQSRPTRTPRRVAGRRRRRHRRGRPPRRADDRRSGRRTAPRRSPRPPIAGRRGRRPRAAVQLTHHRRSGRTGTQTTRRTAAMPKMKTHSGAKKRFRITGTGKVMREQAGNGRHLLEHKSTTRTRRIAGDRRGRPGRRQEDQEAARQVSRPHPYATTGTASYRLRRQPAPTRSTHVARVKRAVNAQKKRRVDPRAGQRLPRAAFAPVPQGQGAGHPLPRSTPTATAEPARATSVGCGSSASTPRPAPTA